MTDNRYGLPRRIPDPVRREVRQACGFGCVFCGASIVEYEHVDPEFSKARTHDSTCIALLCPTCHGKVTRGFLSKRRVKEALQSPKCIDTGFSNVSICAPDKSPVIHFGGVRMENTHTPIEIHGYPLIRVQPPEQEGAPYRISASFFDEAGNPSLLIRENEWITSSSSWDVEISGGEFVVRSAPGKICLRVEVIPDVGIRVSKVNMRVWNYEFIGDQDDLEIFANGRRMAHFRSCAFIGFGTALSLR